MNGEIFCTRYYKLNKFWLQRLGLWPEQSRTVKIIIQILTVLAVYSVAAGQVVRWSESHGDLEVKMAIFSSCVLAGGNTTIMTCFLMKNKIVLELLKGVSRDWKSVLRNFPFTEILKKNAEEGRRQTIVHAILIWLAAVVTSVLSLTPLFLDIVLPLNESRPKSQFLYVEYGIDPDKYYYPILLHTYFVTAVSMTIYVAGDGIFTVWVQHCCALFEIASYCLGNILEKFDTVTYGDNKMVLLDDELAYRNLCISVEYHEKAIEFARLIEKLYSPILGYVTAAAMTAMSTTGFVFMIRMDNFNVQHALQYLAFGFGIMYYSYYMMMLGQKLIDFSSELSDQAYGSLWYSFSPRIQSLIILIIARSQKPCYLTAANFCVINMENFSAILKTSASYLTMFSSLR